MTRTQNSVEELVLRSAPVKVVMAGFESTTLELARAGWDLSMKQIMFANQDYGRPHLQLAMRHEGANMYALTHPVNLDFGVGHAWKDPMFYRQVLESLCFDVMVMHPNIGMRHIMPVRGQPSNFFGAMFDPIDAIPSREPIEENVKDFKFFKVAKQSVRDILVSPHDVPDLLELVLRAQKPTIEDIKKRERSRENLIDGPRTEVTARILTLAQ